MNFDSIQGIIPNTDVPNKNIGSPVHPAEWSYQLRAVANEDKGRVKVVMYTTCKEGIELVGLLCAEELHIDPIDNVLQFRARDGGLSANLPEGALVIVLHNRNAFKAYGVKLVKSSTGQLWLQHIG